MADAEQAADKRSNTFRAVLESRGMKFNNQLRSRSFSLNIFRMNAVALIEATQHIRDTDNGLSLMSQDNRDEGRQAHRELSRHLHNFTASAMTLVDHTRVFMKANYEGTSVHADYLRDVTQAFATDPVSQFVQGLRNYMVHKGLPNSQMFFEMKANQGDATFVTGIRIDTASLLEWDGWKSPAREYLLAAGETLDVHRFTEDYLARVDHFHAGLESALIRFHEPDLTELDDLQRKHAEADRERKPIASTQAGLSSDKAVNEGPVASEPDSLLHRLRAICDGPGQIIFTQIREIKFGPAGNRFPSQRHVAAEITDEDIIGPLTYWGPDEAGIRSLCFIRSEGKEYGLSEVDYQALGRLIDAIMGDSWVRKRLSRSFIEAQFFEWARQQFACSDTAGFAEVLIEAANEKVRSLDVWLPISHLEVEEPLAFGPVHISPIRRDLLTALEEKAVTRIPEQAKPISALFERLRKELQGSAAVVVCMDAEPILAEERALLIGRDAVNILRFFAPGAAVLTVLCPTALAGEAVVPQSKVLMLTEELGLTSMTERVAAKEVGYWQMPASAVAQLDKMGLGEAGKLIVPDDLNEIQRVVRASLITYSKGTTFSDPIDRLSHTLSAVEGLLLKHRMEPVEFNVAGRMSIILSPDGSERAEIAQGVRQAYRLRARNRTAALSPREIEGLARFTDGAYAVLLTGLENVNRFQTRSEFVAAIDQLGADAESNAP